MILAQPELNVPRTPITDLFDGVEVRVRRALRRVPAAGLRGRVVTGLIADLVRAGLPSLLRKRPDHRARDLHGLVPDRALQRQVRRNDVVRASGPLVDDGAARRRRERCDARRRAPCAARVAGGDGGDHDGHPEQCQQREPSTHSPSSSDPFPFVRRNSDPANEQVFLGRVPVAIGPRLSFKVNRLLSEPPTTMLPGRSGGTGRRAGLKIRFPPGSVGSIPTFGIAWLRQTRALRRLRPLRLLV